MYLEEVLVGAHLVVLLLVVDLVLVGNHQEYLVVDPWEEVVLAEALCRSSSSASDK